MLPDPKWFYATVENVDDPTESGMVQIRGFGVHELNSDLLSTEFLPWAKVMMPANNASAGGVGNSPTGIKVGSMALCIAFDDAYQDIRIIFTWHGLDEVLGNDVDVLARGFIDSIIQRKQDTLEKSEDKGVEFVEPVTDYANVKYPHNNVYRTISGHIQEFDNTPGQERIHLMHKSGSYYEMMSSGDYVNKSIGNRYTLTVKDDNQLVRGKRRAKIFGDTSYRYGASLYCYSADQMTHQAQDNMLFLAKQLIEIQTELFNVIGTLKVSKKIYVPEIEVGTLKCDNLSVRNVIDGVARAANAASVALGKGSPDLSPGAGPGDVNTNAKLENPDGQATSQSINTTELKNAYEDGRDIVPTAFPSFEEIDTLDEPEQIETTDEPLPVDEEVIVDDGSWYASQIPNIPLYGFKYATVHCTATRPNDDHDVNSIRRMHIKKNWADIGYHVLIKRDGTIQIGRPWNVKGAHVKGHNSHNIGIVLVGGINQYDGKPEDNYTSAQWAALSIVLKDVMSIFNIPSSNVKGHRDWSRDLNNDGKITSNEWIKACPCFDVQAKLPSLI